MFVLAVATNEFARNTIETLKEHKNGRRNTMILGMPQNKCQNLVTLLSKKFKKKFLKRRKIKEKIEKEFFVVEQILENGNRQL